MTQKFSYNLYFIKNMRNVRIHPISNANISTQYVQLTGGYDIILYF